MFTLDCHVDIRPRFRLIAYAITLPGDHQYLSTTSQNLCIKLTEPVSTLLRKLINYNRDGLCRAPSNIWTILNGVEITVGYIHDI